MVRFAVMTWLKEFGRSEDGEPLIGEVGMVVAEFDNGKRLAQPESLNLFTVVHDEDGFPHLCANKQNRTVLQQVADAFAKQFDSNMFETWGEIEPRYGSDRYHENWRQWETED